MQKTESSWSLLADRYFDPATRDVARQLYEPVAHLPLVCPHGHVDPRMFADPDYNFGSPVDLLIIPDHYVFRMLYSAGIPLEQLGVPRVDGGSVETDHRKIWQIFADHFHLFRGTPTGIWLKQELIEVFGITTRLTPDTAQVIYDQIADALAKPEFRPRALFVRFNIEVLTTTDAATDTLEYHQAIRDSGWRGRIVPTFRPDAVVNLDTAGWRDTIRLLETISGIHINGYSSFVQALEQRRSAFKALGAVATDHAALTAYTGELSDHEADAIFQHALSGRLSEEETIRFRGHMLMEMARMSLDDGLVMQLHVGSQRDHSASIYKRFGQNKGADIPIQAEFTRALRPLLDKVGSDPRLTLILFTLDETNYGRELAPLAGLYPAVKLGPPWWFFDSLNGFRRYFDQVVETAGLSNTAGFNDDTRAFPSIPARHDVWRRAAADWIAGLVVRGIVDMTDAEAMIHDCAIGLASRAYRIGAK